METEAELVRSCSEDSEAEVEDEATVTVPRGEEPHSDPLQE